MDDRRSLRDILNRDRMWSAYALCDLDDKFFSDAEWTLDPDGVVLVYKGLTPPILLLVGDVENALARVSLPERMMLSIRAEHLPLVMRHAYVRDVCTMVRMSVTPQDFRSLGDFGSLNDKVVRLTENDAHEVASMPHADDALDSFVESQVGHGIFFGVRNDSGMLVSVAGTHVISDSESCAGVGNVYTLPEYRGRGYARLTTGAVTAELLARGIQTIVLNVQATNHAARNVYARLGYVEACEFLEGFAVRK